MSLRSVEKRILKDVEVRRAALEGVTRPWTIIGRQPTDPPSEARQEAAHMGGWRGVEAEETRGLNQKWRRMKSRSRSRSRSRRKRNTFR